MGSGICKSSKADSSPLLRLYRERKELIGSSICKQSKVDSSPLLRLCRERQELIKAVADCRYRLAAAHVMYFQSLLDVGNALNQFVEEEFLVLTDFSLDSEDEVISLTDDFHDHSELSGCSLSNSRSSPSATSHAICEQPGKLDASYSHFQHDRTKSFGLPSGVYVSDVRYDQSKNQLHSQAVIVGFSDNGSREFAGGYLQHESQGTPVSSLPESPQKGFHLFDNGVEKDDYYHNQPKNAAYIPSASPINDLVDWGFLDPFKTIDDINSNYYSQNYHFSDFSSEQDFQDLREREGIPDLEDETVSNSVNAFKDGEFTSTVRESSGSGTSQDSASEYKKKSDPIIDEEDTIITSVEHTMNQDDESLELSSLAKSDDYFSKNIDETVKEVGDTFMTVMDHGKEVAVFLEAGKLPYQPTWDKTIGSRFFGFNPLRSNQVAPKIMMTDKAITDDAKDTSRKFGDLSFTLEQLSAWEKKLYFEVLEEEKLRVMYDKKYEKQKVLDDKGAESSEIDNIYASVKKLLSKLNVAVAAVYTISQQISRLRDSDLLDQLQELIEGLMKMWKSIVKCHQKQFRTIIGAKAYVHMANADIRKSSNMKATQRLEKEILNWGSTFRDYISTQKAFVKLLNQWLSRCILQKPEATHDEIPAFSPCSSRAPPIFIICRVWYHAIDKISDSGVYEAIHSFASSLHWLWEKQNEEQLLSRDYENILRVVHEDGSLHWNQDDLVTERGDRSDIDLMMSTDKRLVEELKAKHEEVVRQLNDAAASCLQDGLVPIFEGLETFCLDNMKAYENIRVLNKHQGMYSEK